MKDQAAIAVAALLFSTGGAVIKWITLSSWQIAAGRSLIAAAMLMLLLPESRRLGGLRVWVAAAAYAATLVLFVVANKLTTAAAAIYLQATAPLHMLFLAPWLLGEPISRREQLLGLTMAGAIVLLFAEAAGGQAAAAMASAPHPLAGNILATASGFTLALTVVALRSTAKHRDSSSLPMVFAGNILAFAVAAPFAFPVPSVTAADALALVFLGTVQVGLAYWFLNRGIRRVPAFEASAIILLEPAANPVWAWLLVGEWPGPFSIVGGLLIMGSALIVASTGARHRTDCDTRTPAPR